MDQSCLRLCLLHQSFQAATARSRVAGVASAAGPRSWPVSSLRETCAARELSVENPRAEG